MRKYKKNEKMKRIYLDNAATTRVDSLVAEKVNEFFVDS